MIVNNDSLDAVNRAFNEEITRVFSERPPGTYSLITRDVPASGSTNIEHIVLSLTGNYREWKGSRVINPLRAYSQQIDLKRWEDTIEVAVSDINAGNASVSMTLAQFASRAASHSNEIVWTEVLSNPTCYDGVALLSNSHPNVASGYTTDNLTTNGLGFSEYKTGFEALRDMGDEAGKPLGCRATHLFTGPELEELAQQIVGEPKPVGFANTGEPATSSVVQTELLKNYIGGGVTAVVEPFIRNSEWFLFDTSKAAMPMYCYKFSDWKHTVRDSDDSDPVFNRDVVEYGLSAHLTPAAGAWQTCYGSVTA